MSLIYVTFHVVVLQYELPLQTKGHRAQLHMSQQGATNGSENAPAIITDREFVQLLLAAKRRQPEVMLQIIELFREGIETIRQRYRILRGESPLCLSFFPTFNVEDTS